MIKRLLPSAFTMETPRSDGVAVGVNVVNPQRLSPRPGGGPRPAASGRGPHDPRPALALPQ